MSILKRSATKRSLATLSRLIPSESFASSSVHPFTLISHLYRAKNYGFPDIGISKFHRGTKSLEFRESDVGRAGFAMEDSVFDEEESMSSKNEGLEIVKLGIVKEIVSCLAKRGITTLFPIQRAVLEPAMQGRDVIGCAKTGTGKTLAFGIPIMDKIMQFNAKHGRGRNPLALILAPTRELARQVEKEFRESSSLDTICVYQGVPIQSQIKTLQYGVDVVVGTPGRIIDLIKRSSLNLSEIQFVVLDEADQMLAVGFDEDVEVILDKLPKKRQSMMFSATMHSWITKLTQKYLKEPETIDLVGENDQKLAEGITLYSIATENHAKASILGPLLKKHAKEGKCIIFTQTKHNADRLAYAMSKSFKCEPLHGDISQNQRGKTLTGFRDGRFNILIATDVAAHGLDMPNVDLVIHYEMPTTSEIFVRRSGRTWQAGKKGSAILIHTYEQARAVRGLELDVGCKFTQLPNITIEGRDENMFVGMSGRRMSGGRFGGGSGYSRGGCGFGGGSGFGRSRGSYGDSGSDRYGFSSGSSSSSSGHNGGFGNSDSRRSSGFGRSGNKNSSDFKKPSNSNKSKSEGLVI